MGREVCWKEEDYYRKHIVPKTENDYVSINTNAYDFELKKWHQFSETILVISFDNTTCGFYVSTPDSNFCQHIWF